MYKRLLPAIIRGRQLKFKGKEEIQLKLLIFFIGSKDKTYFIYSVKLKDKNKPEFR